MSDKKITICVLGKSTVGKTSLIKELMGQPDADVGDQKEFTLNLRINEVDFELILIERTFEDIEIEQMNSVDGFMMVYSVDDQDSFFELKKKHQEIVKNRGTHKFHLLVVGNKGEILEGRKIKREEGERYANETNSDFYETSAVKHNNVRESFLHLSQSILRFKYPEVFENEQPKGNASLAKRCYCF